MDLDLLFSSLVAGLHAEKSPSSEWYMNRCGTPFWKRYF
jgi:hypothetical protein